MRPRNVLEYALWAYGEAQAAILEPPDRLHAKHYPPGEDPGHKGHDAIIGPPFTKAFQRYLDGQRPAAPIRRALRRMHSRDRVQSPEYRICHAIVEAGQPADHVQTIMRCGDVVMLRALGLLYDLTQMEIAGEALRSGEKSVA